MKRFGHLYEKMLDINMIKYAIRRAARGKSKRRGVQRVLDNIDFYAEDIRTRLLAEKVELSPNHTRTIYDNSCGKERVITVAKFYPDQIIHWLFCITCTPVFMRGMDAHCCGSVPNRGGILAKKYTERALKDKKTRYVVKVDIHKFFNSVDHGKLIEMFKRKVKDKRMIALLEAILENGGDGLPIGYYTSQWLSNFFLEELDHRIKEVWHIRHYIRYVDDMVMTDSNKRKLHKFLLSMRIYLKTVCLALKGNYQLWRADSRAVDFVGFQMSRFLSRLRRKIYFRILRRVRRVKRRGEATVTQARGLLSLYGWLTHIKSATLYKEQCHPNAPRIALRQIARAA